MTQADAWLKLAYGEGHMGPQPEEAMRLADASLTAQFPWTFGHIGTVEPPWGMPPLIALTHSSLARLEPARFLATIGQLLQAGADPNVRWRNLSALYGATGINASPAMMKLLLEHGADPNDNESLYHAQPHLEIVKLLLAAGARVTGTNALLRSLDFDALACTEALLANRGLTEQELAQGLEWAIRRRRSLAHFDALLAAGANPAATLHGISAYRRAYVFGLDDAARRLQALTGESEPMGLEAYLAACGRGDRERALALRTEVPAHLLRLLPDQAAAGNSAAVRLMVELGWPIAARGGDWQATALNLAIFRGDPALARFLLEHGASWQETHGYGADVRGTLRYARRERPEPGGDWDACAQVLAEFGMPGDA